MDKNNHKDKCKVNMHMKRYSTLLPITECKLKPPSLRCDVDITTHLLEWLNLKVLTICTGVNCPLKFRNSYLPGTSECDLT